MNNLTDEQIDKIIKQSFKQDVQISDKANAVFKNFNPQKVREQQLKEQRLKEQQFREQQLRIQQMVAEQEKAKTKEQTKQANKKVVEGLFYRRLNRVLSVAAVSLTVVLVGGTALYFNKDKMQGQNGKNETIIYSQSLIKNEPLQYSKEQVVKELENRFVKVYLIGNRDVGVEFHSSYWDEMNNEAAERVSDIYKIDRIEKNIEDIFIGCAENSTIPYIFILNEDGTGMYVDLHGYFGYASSLYYCAQPIEGLSDIVGFEEKTRYFSYTTDEYTYVNAIRSDGKRKEIELNKVNSWEEVSTEVYDKYNKKYIQAHEKGIIEDDGKGDFVVDNIHYWSVNGDSRYAYYTENNSLYRVEKSTGNKKLLADGISGMVRDTENKLTFYLPLNYTIYELDDNVIYKKGNGSVINEITKIESEADPDTSENNTTENEPIEGMKNPYEIGQEYVSFERKNTTKGVYDDTSLELAEDNDGNLIFSIKSSHGKDAKHAHNGSLSGTAKCVGPGEYTFEEVVYENHCVITFKLGNDKQGYIYVEVKESYSERFNPYGAEGITFAGKYEQIH